MASEEGLRAGEPGGAIERVQELERVFGHWHAKAVKGDLCTYCGLDLRDRIHHREPPLPSAPCENQPDGAV